MSTPPVLAKAMGTCSEYKPECIGEGQKVLFYTALALTALGMSGHLTSLGGFMAEQITVSGQQNISQGTFVMFFLSFFGVILVPIIGAIAIPLIHPWSIRFGIPAICTVVATLIFLTGTCSYRYVRPQGSSFTSVFRVFVASASKIFHTCPRDATELYEKDQDQESYMVPHTRGLRFELNFNSQLLHLEEKRSELFVRQCNFLFLQVPRQGCSYITRSNSGRTRKKQMETLQSDRSGGNKIPFTNHSNKLDLYFIGSCIFCWFH